MCENHGKDKATIIDSITTSMIQLLRKDVDLDSYLRFSVLIGMKDYARVLLACRCDRRAGTLAWSFNQIAWGA